MFSIPLHFRPEVGIEKVPQFVHFTLDLVEPHIDVGKVLLGDDKRQELPTGCDAQSRHGNGYKRRLTDHLARDDVHRVPPKATCRRWHNSRRMLRQLSSNLRCPGEHDLSGHLLKQKP